MGTARLAALVLTAGVGCAPNVQNVGECFQCGAGTALEGAVCLGDASRGTCGAGTRWVDGACQVDNSMCGAGAALIAGRCEVTAAACGGGLVLAGGRCQVATPVPLVRPFLDRTGLNHVGRALVFGTGTS